MARRASLTVIAFGVVAVMALAGILLAVFAVARGDGMGGSGRVGLIEVEGVIGDDELLLKQIRELRQDASVHGLLVSINSPGGAVGPSQSVYRELARIRDEDSIPVVATIGAVGASGGYYIALAADSIFALPGSLTGSIGVLLEMPDASGLMEKVGVRMQVVKSAEHKDAGSPFRELSESDRAILEAMVDDVYDQFVDVVVTERQLSRQSIEGITDGRVMSGRQALEYGLIDGLGNFNDALAAVGRMAGLGDEPEIARPESEGPGWLGILRSRAGMGALVRAATSNEPWTGPRLKYVVPW